MNEESHVGGEKKISKLWFNYWSSSRHRYIRKKVGKIRLIKIYFFFIIDLFFLNRIYKWEKFNFCSIELVREKFNPVKMKKFKKSFKSSFEKVLLKKKWRILFSFYGWRGNQGKMSKKFNQNCKTFNNKFHFF